MNNIHAKAWICVIIMMLGVGLGMVSMGFLGNRVILYIILGLGIAMFLAGFILHFVIVRCSKCGSHIGRVYGNKCPFCGEDYD